VGQHVLRQRGDGGVVRPRLDETECFMKSNDLVGGFEPRRFESFQAAQLIVGRGWTEFEF
jgi:hypothetical protein